jgi:hypothetical protein
MAKKRLSRLQKWILIEGYKNNHVPKTHDIYEKFWGKDRVWNRMHPYGDSRISNQYVVAVSRSLKNLEKKGLVQHTWPLKSFELTREGKEKTRILLLTSMGINNKNKEKL